MKQFLLLFSLLLSFLLLVTDVSAQTVVQKAKLNQLSKAYSTQFQREKTKALKLADSLGIPVRQEFKDGRVVELMRFRKGKPIYYTTFNNEGARLLKTGQVYPDSAAGLDLSGQGQVIGLWDAGIPLLTHNELIGRVTVQDGTSTSNQNGHATHVAGTLIASGVDPAARGMAFAATVDSYSFDNDLGEMSSAAGSGLLVSVHPYGFPSGWDYGTWNGTDEGWYWWGDINESESSIFGFYDDEAARWDTLAYNAPNYLIVVSGGNDRGDGPAEGADHWAYDNGSESWIFIDDGTVREVDGGTNGYDTISSFALSKNVLAVGALSVSGEPLVPAMWNDSGWGPTDDGRVKPDVVAKGVDVYSSTTDSIGSVNLYAEASGTSYSAPMIAGSAGVLLEHQNNLHGGERLLSSTMKGLIIHTAEDLGETGPDYEFGWGLMNTEKAANVMTADTTKGLHIHELTLSEGQSFSFQIKATGDEPLRATLVWTDPPAGPLAADPYLNPTDPMLVNDLDMILEDESSTFRPYTLDPNNPGITAANGDNNLDNVEMIHIDSPGTGDIFTLTVTHDGTWTNSSQNFSLIITGNEGIDYQQQLTGTEEGWRFFSSPIASTYQELLNPLWTQGSANSKYPPASNSNVRTFNGSTDNYSAVSDLADSLDIGSGVAVYVYEDDDYDGSPDGWSKILTVNGMENLSDVDVSDLLYPGTSSDSSYTLLGNPFNSTIDFDEFEKNSEVGNIVYVYDHDFEPSTFNDPDAPGGDSGGGFRAWNGSAGNLTDGLIAPFQGFLVSTHGSSPSLTIPTTSKTGTSATFHKERSTNPVIQIAAQINGKYSSDTWFSFTESGSLERNENDAPYLYPLDYHPFLSVRSETDGLGYLIKNLPVSLKEPIEIPISVEAWQPDGNSQSPGYIPMSGDVEMVWTNLQNLPNNWTITLTDHHNGSIVDLKKSDQYHFSLSNQKAKAKSLPYSMKVSTAKENFSSGNRFTLTIYPTPLAVNSNPETPTHFRLNQNYPNPFNPTTVIRYSLPETSAVELEVYTIDGQKVATLVNEAQHAGNHTVTFDGSNFSSGVYIYRLITGQRMVSKKMVLIK